MPIDFRYALAFLTPGLPFIPAIAITVNIYLIFKLSILTLVRFTIWMTLGLIMYFYYGITHSSLETTSDEIELNVDQSYLKPQPQQNKTTNYYDNQTPTAVWDRHGYENKMAEDSWSTSIPMTNNYSTNSWDINDVNSAWSGGGSRQQVHESSLSTQPAPSSKQKPGIPPRSSDRVKTASSSTSKSKPPPPPRPTKQPSIQSNPPDQPNQPKSGFSSIFVERSDFPSWED